MAEKSDVKVAPSQERNMGPEKDVGSIDDLIDEQAERKVLRKIDFNLISVFGCLYLMSFLGKSYPTLLMEAELMLTRPIEHRQCQPDGLQ